MARVLMVRLFCEDGEEPPPTDLIRRTLECEGILGNYDRLELIAVKESSTEALSDGEITEIRRGLELTDQDELEVLFLRCKQEPVFPRAAVMAAVMGLLITGPPTEEELGCKNPNCPVHGLALLADQIFREQEEEDSYSEDSGASDYLN